MKLIALDLDDTLHNRSNIRPGYKMGTPTVGALDFVHKLIELGYTPYVLTASTDERLKSVSDWLRYFKFPDMQVTNKKLDAEAFVDNKAIRFSGDWDAVLEAIRG